MCICVNCRHISKCQTYFFIEQQHKFDKKKNCITFIPNNNLIQINIKNNVNNIIFDWDLIECLSFVEKPGSWLI
uniref:Ycf34 n=1 Tax=Acrosorium ciliolatum TaxID=1550622 RepID=A0A1Z1M1L5_9FLOR|nr:hypothetical protein [Acrosorium ciliolatum]ARW59969.1 hypothetical protein [Acrosorium ciliolatum]